MRNPGGVTLVPLERLVEELGAAAPVWATLEEFRRLEFDEPIMGL